MPAILDGSGASSHGDVPTSLYLYYDDFNVLLYVGITRRGIKRNHEHSDTQQWWPYVSRQEVTHLPSRRAALRAERETIIQRRPPFNRQHNPGHEELAVAYHRFHAAALAQRQADAEAPPKPVEKPRKVKQPKAPKVQQPAPARPMQTLRDVSECAFVPLDLISRDGKFLRCHARPEDAASTGSIDLTATRFDRFRAGPHVGSIMSLARGNHGIEMVLKGTWAEFVTAATLVVHRGDRLIHALQLTVKGREWLTISLGRGGQATPNVGRFSNGALSRPGGRSQGGAV